MKSYEPYLVESVSQVDETRNFYVFDVIPPLSKTGNKRDENYCYELHIKTMGAPIYYKDFLHSHIHLESIDHETIEIYTGQTYEESCSDEPIKYESIDLVKFEKKFRAEWKSKVENQRRKFSLLLSQKIGPYIITRSEVVKNYQSIYDHSLSSLNDFGLTMDDITKPYLFRILYQSFEHSHPEDCLNKFIDPDYFNKKQTKSWKQDFDNLYKKTENLRNMDVNDYQTIKNQMVENYKRTYHHMMRSLTINHPMIDEKKYERYFNHLISKLKDTA